jgi:hypothetical protein
MIVYHQYNNNNNKNIRLFKTFNIHYEPRDSALTFRTSGVLPVPAQYFPGSIRFFFFWLHQCTFLPRYTILSDVLFLVKYYNLFATFLQGKRVLKGKRTLFKRQ